MDNYVALGQNEGKTLPSSLPRNPACPIPSSSHSTGQRECGKKCQEERQEGALPESTAQVPLHSFPLVHRTPLGVGYHYPHLAAEESQGSRGLTIRAAVFLGVGW